MKDIKKVFLLTLSALLFVFCMFTLTSCGNYREAKRESKQKIKRYKQDLIQGVKEAYGDDVKVKNIKSGIDVKLGEVVPEPYFTSYAVEGTFELNGKKYNVYYDEKEQTIKDTVHTGTIREAMMDELPFDKSKYLKYKCAGNFEYLTPDIDTLEELLDSGYVFFNIYIVTTEDLSVYENYDIKSLPIYNKLEESKESGCLKMHIACVDDTSRYSLLLSDMERGMWFNGREHPTVREDGEDIDAFEYYGIKNTLDIDGTTVKYMD